MIEEGMVECPVCTALISDDRDNCPICGEELGAGTDKEKAIEELTKISGVGPAKAKTLYDNGFESPDDILNGGMKGLAEVSHIGFSTAKEIFSNAKEVAMGGEEEEQECPICGAAVAADAEGCPECGEPLGGEEEEEEESKDCPECGAEVGPNVEICYSCGADLVGDEEVEMASEDYEEIKEGLEEMVEDIDNAQRDETKEEVPEETREEKKKLEEKLDKEWENLADVEDSYTYVEELKGLLNDAAKAKMDGNYETALDKIKTFEDKIADMEGEVEELRDKEKLEEQLEDARQSLARARRTSIDASDLKGLMIEAYQAQKAGDIKTAVDRVKEVQRKGRNIRLAFKKMQEAKSKAKDLKERGFDYEFYLSDLKEGKAKADEGDYSEAIEIFERTMAEMERPKEKPERAEKTVEKPTKVEAKERIEKASEAKKMIKRPEVSKTEKVTKERIFSMIFPVYYFVFPLFLLVYVALEAVFVLSTHPDLMPSYSVLALTPAYLPLGISVPTLIAAVMAAAVLAVITIHSVEIDGKTVKIERFQLTLGTLVGMVMAFSLAMGWRTLSIHNLDAMYLLMLALVLGLVVSQAWMLWGES
ncbi:MAG: zinc ribbon domain-containing protein [Candidatus Thermoplasmatota archaeon]